LLRIDSRNQTRFPKSTNYRYTAWWEVEGEAGLDGEFECMEVVALQHRLITMPIKQFDLVAALAYHVCALDAEVEGQPCPR
jgi:hypothetical protein